MNFTLSAVSLALNINKSSHFCIKTSTIFKPSDLSFKSRKYGCADNEFGLKSSEPGFENSEPGFKIVN